MVRWISEKFSCDSGATAMEYSLVAGMTALVIIVAVTNVGAEVASMLQGLVDSL